VTFPQNIVKAAEAATGELDWPSKQIVRPRDIELSYPCDDGEVCDLSSFIDRQHVCALVVISAGEQVLYRTSVRSDEDPCKTAVERDRYGIASMTKSIVSLLFGFVYQDPNFGMVVDLDMPAVGLLAQAGVLRFDRSTTLRQLLQMSSGMKWSEESEKDSLKILVDEKGDLQGDHRTLKEAVNARLQGARFDRLRRFSYSAFDSQLIGILTEGRLSQGKGFNQGTLDEALEHFLWRELSVDRNAEWNADFDGHPAAHCCAYTSARDLARLGEWLRQQMKDGTSPIADWIRSSVTDTVDAFWGCTFGGTKLSFRYGYQWWLPSADKEDGFTAIGTEGQYLHIFPEQGVVVAQLGEKVADDPSTCEAMLVHRLIADQVRRP
jgi:CubicO group peptidase (beta-lactamase class C family)